MTSEEKRKTNLRMGLILASVALAVFIGFMIKMAVLSSR